MSVADLLNWVSEQEVFVEVNGVRKKVAVSNCSKVVSSAGRQNEMQYAVTKRLIEAGREALLKDEKL